MSADAEEEAMAACRNVSDALSRYLDGEAAPDEAARVRAHVASCAGCRAELEEGRRVDAFVAGAFRERAAAAFGPSLVRSIVEKARAARPEESARPAKVLRGPWQALWVRQAAAAAAVVAIVAGLALWIASSEDGTGGRPGKADREPVAERSGGEPVGVLVAENGGQRVKLIRAGTSTYATRGERLPLKPGDSLLTEARTAEVALDGGVDAGAGRLVLREDTSVRFDGRPQEGGPVVVALATGTGEVFADLPRPRTGVAAAAIRIATRQGVVEATGGARFGVRVSGGETVVTVLDGRVLLARGPGAGAAANATTLLANQRGRLATSVSASVAVESVAALTELAWVPGLVPPPAVTPGGPQLPVRPVPPPPAPAPRPPGRPGSGGGDLPIEPPRGDEDEDGELR